jgi:hypothetical protein
VGSIRGSGRPDRKATRHVDDLYSSLEEILSASEAVQGLVSHAGWNHAQAAVASEVDLIDRKLDSGIEPLSRAEYAMWHGRRGGLLFLAEALDAIVLRAAQRYEEQRSKHEGAGESVPEGALA